MATLWNKGTKATDIVEEFTVGQDRQLDLRLAKYDVQGSVAHIRMLAEIGLLEASEEEKLEAELKNIAGEIERGNFELEDDVEDIHSQVELLLTRKLGEIGKKIHSGRSRNDQVLVDLKLFLRDECCKIRDEITDLFDTLVALSEKYKKVLMPGYTLFQIAMPSTIGLWLGAYAESLADDMLILRAAYEITDMTPLGSAAGYGSSIPLDRASTTKALGFKTMSYNSIAAQMGRGKTEKAVAAAIGMIAGTLNKLAEDCCIYMSGNFGYIKFPDELTTGSSIMPHKKLPEVWEIIRGHCDIMHAQCADIAKMSPNLPHGYHRDYQLLKETLFPALEKTHSCIKMARYMLENMSVNKNILANPIYEQMFTVEKVNALVLDGIPFRDAYRKVGEEVNSGKYKYYHKELKHTHLGSIGNLATKLIKKKMRQARF